VKGGRGLLQRPIPHSDGLTEKNHAKPHPVLPVSYIEILNEYLPNTSRNHYRVSQLAQVHRIYFLQSVISMIKEIRRKLAGNVASTEDIIPAQFY
jgi:hypothetical protein